MQLFTNYMIPSPEDKLGLLAKPTLPEAEAKSVSL